MQTLTLTILDIQKALSNNSLLSLIISRILLNTVRSNDQPCTRSVLALRQKFGEKLNE